MTFTPEEMKQIVAKSGPAWDAYLMRVAERYQEMANEIRSKVLRFAKTNCERLGSDTFAVGIYMDNCDTIEDSQKVAELVFEQLKDLGFKMAGLRIQAGFYDVATFYFGDYDLRPWHKKLWSRIKNLFIPTTKRLT